MPLLRLLCLLLLLVSVCACDDHSTWETPIYGPYHVCTDPATSTKSLYYRDANGRHFARFTNVSRVGYQAGYVILQAEQNFYWFAVQQDKATDLADPALEGLIHGPLNRAALTRLLPRLGLDTLVFPFPPEAARAL